VSRHRRRARPRRLLAALAAALLLTTAAPLAVAQEDGEQDESAEDVRLTLASQTTFVQPDGEFVMRLRAANADPGAELRVSVHSRLTSRSAFTLTTQGNRLGRQLRTTSADLDSLDQDSAGAITVRLGIQSASSPPTPDRLRLTTAGVYPIRVQLRTDEEVTAQLVTYLIRVPDDAAATPLRTALVVPVDAAPGLTPEGELQTAPATLDRVSTVVDALRGHAGLPLVVAPVPETIDSLAGGGAEDGGATIENLSQGLASRQLLGGPYVPIDLDAFVAAGLEAEAAAQLTRGADVVARLVQSRPDSRTYVSAERVTADGLARLRELGIDQVVLREDNLEPLDLTLTLTRPFEIEGTEGRLQRAAAADPGLARHFTTSDPVLGAHRLLADLSVLFFDAPGSATRGVVVVPPQRWTPTGPFLDALLSGLEQAPMLEPTTLDGLFEGVENETDDDGESIVRTLRRGDSDQLRLVATAVRDTRSRLDGFRSMIAVRDGTSQGEPQRGPARAVFDSLEKRLLVAEGERLTLADRRAYLAGVNATIDDQAGSVEAPQRQTVTLTAREGAIPLTFRNATGYPVQVRVQLDSAKLEFPEGSSGEFTLREANTTASFRVRARTSGAFPVDVSVSAPACCLDLAQARLTVRSTAVSGVGVVLSIGAAGFLMIWWLSHFRRVRRGRRLVGERERHGTARRRPEPDES
jgi:hypothetical protein